MTKQEESRKARENIESKIELVENLIITESQKEIIDRDLIEKYTNGLDFFKYLCIRLHEIEMKAARTEK